MQEVISVTQEISFKERFCAASSCRADQFDHRLFWQCLHRRALPFAWLLKLVHRGFFSLDLALIQEAGNIDNLDDLRNLIGGYREDCVVRGNFIHEKLRMRVSGRRLLAAYDRLNRHA
jgi:hypothetical protein